MGLAHKGVLHLEPTYETWLNTNYVIPPFFLFNDIHVVLYPLDNNVLFALLHYKIKSKKTGSATNNESNGIKNVDSELGDSEAENFTKPIIVKVMSSYNNIFKRR